MTKSKASDFMFLRRHTPEIIGLLLLLVTTFTMMGRVLDLLNASNRPQNHVAIRRTDNQQALHSQQQLLLRTEVPFPTRAPYVYKNETTKQKCYKERDLGIIPALRQASHTFCKSGGWDKDKQRPTSFMKATKISTFQVGGGIKSTVFNNLMLDFVDVKIHAPIASMAQDGGKHDPRFVFSPNLINCVCDEFANYITNISTNRDRQLQQVWQSALMRIPNNDSALSSICSPKRDLTANHSWDFMKNPLKSLDLNETLVFEDPVVLIARRDDHNPFFQISNALNSWIMLQVLNWDVTKTHVIHLDGGYPSPIDELHQKLLSPNQDLIAGTSLLNKRVHFRGEVMIAPFEVSGPMMQHLNNKEPCFDSELLKTFRSHSLKAMGITLEAERSIGMTSNRPMYVTTITRRPYSGRELQRVWLNEDEIMEKMRNKYSDVNVVFRSVDFVSLTLAEQMKTTIESDMIVSMHGAGLVNVLWSRPKTTIIEIFPIERFRWGYRNLCQFLGCDWHQFRGGEDVGEDPHPNSKNKRITYDEWMIMFEPHFNNTYRAYQEQQERELNYI
ncbi:hypothetical protein F443_18664 [Plasmopara halstedii]|uniref:Glycosyltransferase 61 catalytic domain-containing protein n=1 Tax=Plasmopara halstedii TaxID=4781 RepID=A0A0P1AK34_PLAHL|nr:hypothetical protein F443_18664 [Plasmopara halstedii]CEG41601.1 hypothetical protein F443_18664 [Plasmopara halstedii]|eukprot:XP_024577970.1 hypothetical protein F443_18664 [Plasmopara halstedii]